MVFGQPAGPPAPPRQVQELLELLNGAGHTGFRDARGPMGFTQRQAAGRFTRLEAAAFIEQLLETARPPDGEALPVEPDQAPETPAGPSPLSDGRRALGGVPAERLAAELRDRGWTVTGPADTV